MAVYSNNGPSIDEPLWSLCPVGGYFLASTVMKVTTDTIVLKMLTPAE